MEIVNKQKEIEIRHLLCCICLKWKKILLYTLGVMIFTGVINGVRSINYFDVLEKSIIIKVIVLRMILIGLIFGFFMVGVYILKYIFSDVIKTEDEFINVCNINLIGKSISLKKYNMIDGWIKKIFGISNDNLKEEDYINHIAKAIEMDLETRDTNDNIVIAVVSSCSKKKIEDFVGKLDLISAKNVKIVYAGDITKDAGAIDIIYSAKYTLLVECQCESKYSHIENICNRLCMWKKSPIGAVILGANIMY